MVMIHTKDNPPVVAAAAEKVKPKSKSSKTKKDVGPTPSLAEAGPIFRPSWAPDFVKEKDANGRVFYKQTKSHSKNISHDDDVVMVDRGAHGDPLVTSGPDDLAFVDHPSPLKRSNTAPRKSGGFFSGFGLFGGGAKATEPELQRPRSTTLSDAEDQVLPIRTKDRSKRKSRVADEGFTTDAPAETDADIAAKRVERKSKREARDQIEEVDRADHEQRRKERREREKADLEARQRKARERAKKEQEAEEQRREEKRARRAAREARIQQEELEASREAEKRREERRNLRAQLEAEKGGDLEAVKKDRRKSYYAEEEERRKRREETSKDKDRGKSRKKSSALAEEYHQSRSGSGKGTAPPANKTSSWVDSQADEPPEVPPVEPTILDPSGEKPRRADDEYDQKRRSRHRDRHATPTDAEMDDRRSQRRARRGDKSPSGGSDERKERRKRRDRDDRYAGYGEETPVRTFDGRPMVGRNDSKRKSFLGGLF
jgi:hypothetical protein